MTTGLQKCEANIRPEWSVGHRQGVYFLPETERIKSYCDSITVNVDFCNDGQLLFHFQHGS